MMAVAGIQTNHVERRRRPTSKRKDCLEVVLRNKDHENPQSFQP